MGETQVASAQPFVIAFDSTHAAMAAQAAFKAAGASFAISAECGMSLKFKAEGAAEAQAFVADTVTGDAAKCATLYEATGYTKLS